MGPGKSGFWLPLARLSAFFAAVVGGGSLVFHAVQPENPEGSTFPVETVDYFNKKKRKLERHLRALEKIIDGAPVPSSSDASTDPTPVVRAPSPDRSSRLAYIEPEAPPYEWPSPLELPALREIDLPRSLADSHEPFATPELVARWLRLGAPAHFFDVEEILLRGPEFVVDSLLSLAGGLFPRPEVLVWHLDEGPGMAARIFDFRVERRQGRIFSEFIGHMLEREQRYFARFEDSALSTVAFDDGTVDVDMDELVNGQRKILWDALRKTYFTKYKFKAEDRIRDEAFYFNQWRGVDFAVVPPLIAAYVWYRGFDKRFSFGDTWLRFSFEPLSEWVSRGKDDDLVSGVSLEWWVKGFPVGLIVSAGLYDGTVKLDFVGIGTSVGMAKKSLAMQRNE
jgi:hypothetical protein